MMALMRFRSTNPLVLRLFHGVAWGVVGTLFGRMLALLLSIATARLLQTERFGQFLMLQSTLGMIGVFAGLGLGVVATKFAAELHQRDAERLGRILSLVRLIAIVGSMTVALVLVFLAPAIATTVFHRPELTFFVRITSVTVVFLTLDGYNTAALFGLEHIKQSIQGMLLSALLSTPVALLLTWQFGLAGAVYGVLLSSIMQCIASLIMLRRALNERCVIYRQHSRAEWRVLYEYALPSLLGGIMVLPIHWVCQAMLANSPQGMIQVAVLGISLQWFQLVSFLPAALGRVVLPILTDVVASGIDQRPHGILRTSVLANAVISVPVAIVVSVFSKLIMHMYAVNLYGASVSLTLMVAASSVAALCSPVGQIMVAKGQVWYGWLMNFGWAIVYLGLARVLVGWGAVGIATALLMAYVAHGVWSWIWTWNSSRSAVD